MLQNQIEYEKLYQTLRKSEFGMTRPVFEVLVAVLIKEGYLVGYKGITQVNLESCHLPLSEAVDTLCTGQLIAEELQEQLGRLSQAVIFFESKLPPASEIDSVLENITIIAKKNSLTSNMIRTLMKSSYNGYIELPLKMELSGNFKSYYSFLLELEQLDRITKIRELRLSKDSDREGHIKASFTVSIFFRQGGF